MKNSENDLHQRLRTLAQNLWWTWHPEVIRLFTDLDPHLWREVDHNPMAFLNRISPEQVEQRAAEALELCKRAYILEAGRITMSGDQKEMIGNPKVQKAYLDQDCSTQ